MENSLTTVINTLGYTHYYRTYYKKEDIKNFSLFLTNALKIIELASQEIVLVDELHFELPRIIGSAFKSCQLENIELEEFNKETLERLALCINGEGVDAHETAFFTFDQLEMFNSCKTARKPYDRVITALLIELKSCMGNSVGVSSDGDVEDWYAGDALRDRALKLAPSNSHAHLINMLGSYEKI